MKIAITGGTGFIGGHLAENLSAKKHRLVLVARGYDQRNSSVRLLPRSQFVGIGLSDPARLAEAFENCEAVAHCAGISYESEEQTFEAVHVEGTASVVSAAKSAGVKRILLISSFAARPDCKSPYLESKFAAEQIVRDSGLEYTICRIGLVYGAGDHLLNNLSHLLFTLPVISSIEAKSQYVYPLAIEDLVKIMEAALIEGRLSEQTVAVLGPDKLSMNECIRRVAKIIGKSPVIMPLPVIAHYGLARLMEKTMKLPLLTEAEARILFEGFAETYFACEELPEDLSPETLFTAEQIRKGLPEPGPYKIEDLSCWQG